jgi:hypothetical protein
LSPFSSINHLHTLLQPFNLLFCYPSTFLTNPIPAIPKSTFWSQHTATMLTDIIFDYNPFQPCLKQFLLSPTHYDILKPTFYLQISGSRIPYSASCSSFCWCKSQIVPFRLLRRIYRCTFFNDYTACQIYFAIRVTVFVWRFLKFESVQRTNFNSIFLRENLYITTWQYMDL